MSSQIKINPNGKRRIVSCTLRLLTISRSIRYKGRVCPTPWRQTPSGGGPPGCRSPTLAADPPPTSGYRSPVDADSLDADSLWMQTHWMQTPPAADPSPDAHPPPPDTDAHLPPCGCRPMEVMFNFSSNVVHSLNSLTKQLSCSQNYSPAIWKSSINLVLFFFSSTLVPSDSVKINTKPRIQSRRYNTGHSERL